MALWVKLMRFVPPDGIGVRELRDRSGLDKDEFKLWLERMSHWWGYLAAGGERPDWVMPSAGGRAAIAAWQPLNSVVEQRWEARFGQERVERLRKSMQAILKRMGGKLANSLPLMGYELKTATEQAVESFRGPGGSEDSVNDEIPSLLSKLLLACAIEFEGDLGVSIAICANLLRLADEDGIPVRDVPRLAGVSKEAAAMLVKRAVEFGLATIQSEPGRRTKRLALTAGGERLKAAYSKRVWEIEARWKSEYGHEDVAQLRSVLEELTERPQQGQCRLFEGLRTYPDNWRAQTKAPEVLPHFPMILHRGGYPDGS